MAVISQTYYSKLSGINRIDSEYFDPEYLELEKILSRVNTVPITAVTNVSDGNHMSISKYFTDSHDGIPYYRGQDVNDFFLENADPYRISKDAFYKRWMQRSHFRSGDVLLSIVGTVGSLSYVTDRIKESTGSCKIAILRPGDKIDGRFLSAFLKSKYGQFQIKRNVRGAIQTGLILKDMVFIRVPEISSSDEKRISALVQKSIDENFKSKDLYTQATQLLEDALGLDKLKFRKGKSINVISFSELVDANRFDGQCFKPEFLRYQEWIESNYQYNKLGDLSEPFVKGQQQEIKVSGIPYASIKDIDGIELKTNSYCSSSRSIAQKESLLLAITGATIGKIGVVSRNEQLAFSGDLLNIRPINQKIPTFYLLCVLSNQIGQTQINRWITGSTNGHLSPLDVRKVLIPRLENKTELEIDKLLRESISSKIESEQLLEQAKKEVETLIEQAAQTT
jgi:type I restriction enzyme S subunit